MAGEDLTASGSEGDGGANKNQVLGGFCDPWPVLLWGVPMTRKDCGWGGKRWEELKMVRSNRNPG